MRVIAGIAGSIPLKSPKDLSIRPTADRVKEALFSSLTPRLCGARVLDAFCGSGALGIEALSRGAKEAVFVDKSSDAVSICKENLARTHLDTNATVICTDILSYVESAHTAFDLIFLDPPYAHDLYTVTLQAIHDARALADDGIIVIEYEDLYKPDIPDAFEVIKTKRYGRVFLAFLKVKNSYAFKG